MATVVLSAAGAALGGSIGGTVAGLSSAVIGRAVGATLGKVIDQKVMGAGSQTVETGKVDRFRITGSGEGQAIAQLYGRARLGGHVIWSSDFTETATTSGGGKGGASQPKTTSYSYSVNLAVALCEGEISRVGRVWADGQELSRDDLGMNVYFGSMTQLPDPVMEAIEGAGQVPAYRGTAYVVFENLNLARFGNRIPQFTFEVMRPAPANEAGFIPLFPEFSEGEFTQSPEPVPVDDLARVVEAVALMPGSGEYTLATTPVYYTDGPGSRWAANTHTPFGGTDFSASLQALSEELPSTKASSLIVSWFSGDLRCQHARIQPKVEHHSFEGENMPWRVAGLGRADAETIPLVEDEPVYGGTPTDAAVIEAIHAIHAAGQEVMFYPFILMDQLDDNALPNPYTGLAGQPRLPWRGRITLDLAPEMPGSSDGSAAAEAEVAAFFGTARASDFTVSGNTVSYNGPDEWTFSRFILHYAALCKAAGGVGSFCIGSEMRGMTQIRGAGNSFPFVSALQQLAADVRALLPAAKISYASDWSEYFGYTPQNGTGDRFFHLDPLWADANIDFIGIDNYMPISDWRDGSDHLDAQTARSIYDLDYLKGNIEGGEGYDWYYANEADRDAQIRTPITDAAHNEPWIWRYKDIRAWWENPHHERIGGIRQTNPTAWTPKSKPIWFTEYGCAAINKGANQPNKFLDPKSSESSVPHYSDGQRDDFMQMQYLRAYTSYFADPANNPLSDQYFGNMINMARAFVWAWDARPYPFFPNNRGLWNDGANYTRGHWLTGRSTNRALADVVAEICENAGVAHVDTSGLYGVVRGYVIDALGTGRGALQPLMLAYGFDAVERDGSLQFVMRGGNEAAVLAPDYLARAKDLDGIIEETRDPELELSGRVRVQFYQADGEFTSIAEETVLPDDTTHTVSRSEMPLTLTRAEGRQMAERWLSEARLARDAVRFALPPSKAALGAGDVVALAGQEARYRIDRVEQGPYQIVDAVRVDASVYKTSEIEEDAPSVQPFAAPVPVIPLFLDLPLLSGDESEHAPHFAASAQPWPGSVAMYQSSTDAGYVLSKTLPQRAIIGMLQSPLARARSGLWDNGAPLSVRLTSGQLESAEDAAVLAGANMAAIGDGTPGNWEIIQFAKAELIAPGWYHISRRLRGLQGSDALMPENWPIGSWFVLLNGIPEQIELASNLRGVTQHFRIGPASRGYSDPSYTHLEAAFAGNGLRPYAPVHLRQSQAPSGDIDLSWIRRTRIEGDTWEGEVPLGEERESYRVQVVQNGTVLREAESALASWTYNAIDQATDGTIGATDVELHVAQISARFGAGPTLIAPLSL